MHKSDQPDSSLQVWSSEQKWFWFVVDSHHQRAAIGAAGTKAEALREARSSIEEISACQIRAADARVNSSTSMPALYRANLMACWEGSLACLERYLACVDRPSA